MAHITRDGVLETSTTTGTGAISLGGALTGFSAFSAAPMVTGDTCFYSIRGVDSNGTPTGDYESGIGTYTSSGNTLTRTTVIRSSNSNAAVSLAAGTKYISLSANSAEMQFCPTKTLASDYTNSTVTVSNLTGMSFDAEASADYEVEILGEMQSAATTTGLGFCLTVPTGSTVSGSWDHPQATTQLSSEGWTNASGVVGAKTSGVPAATTSYPCRGRFHVRTSTTAGTVQLQGCSEVASSQITVKAGFMLKARRYN